jgi:hypothetical protein
MPEDMINKIHYRMMQNAGNTIATHARKFVDDRKVHDAFGFTYTGREVPLRGTKKQLKAMEGEYISIVYV